MNPASLILLAFAMSTDAFAASIGRGAELRKVRLLSALRIGAVFGVVEAIMPLLGWALGHVAMRFVSGVDHWIAFVMLALLGGHMIWAGVKKEDCAAIKAAETGEAAEAAESVECFRPTFGKNGKSKKCSKFRTIESRGCEWKPPRHDT